MPLWTFYCYLSENGTDEIDEWYDNLPAKAQAKFDKILEHLRDTPQNEWGKYSTQLSGYEGIIEIKFDQNKIVYRPLGCFAPKRGVFTFLIGAREQGDRFNPRNAPQIAQERRLIILSNEERCHECCF